MAATTKRVEFASASLAIAIAFLAIVFADSAYAQAVGNGSFETPPVGGDPGGLVRHNNPALTDSGVVWTFPAAAGGDSGITVGGAVGMFAAPNAPDGSQMAWIQNLGVIQQSVTLTPGKYVLSFDLARAVSGCSGGNCNDTPPPLPIQVSIGAQTFGPFTPTSAASFDTVTVSFEVAGSQAQVLEFIGTGPAYVRHQEEHTTFIDVVSISRVLPNPVLPEIVSGPSDIDPTSVILLEGEHFGVPTGQIKVVFPSPSSDPFSNGNGSKTEFQLKTVGSDTFAESDTPIDVPHPQGAVDSQSVDITIATAAGEHTSNVWHANFHSKAIITSGPDTITPGRSFNLKGWDFDNKSECVSEKTGTVTVHFSEKSYELFPNQGSNASHTDLVLTIPGSGCLPDAIKMKLPSDTGGVLAQAVTIIYESPGGRKSNPWPAQFVPKLETKTLPWQDVIVSCGNESTLDICNNPNINSVGPCFMQLVPWGQPGYWPPYEDSMIAQHWGCLGIHSNDGTDQYATDIAFGRGWTITGVSIGAIANNAWFSYSVTPQLSTVPVNLLFVDVNWHIGATGGEIFYNGDIYITGPAGVPFE